MLFLHPFGVSNAQAIAAGLLWYRCMLIVSMLGAPAFAVGQRKQTPSTPTLERRARGPSTVERRQRASPAARRCSDGHVLYWWVEILAILVFYFVYSAVRNRTAARHRSARVPATPSTIIRWQQRLGIYHEETIQEWALHFRPLIIAANYFYGSLHFIVTIVAGIFLFRKFSDDYPRFRNTLGDRDRARAHRVQALSRSMPPRLLPGSYGFVDTLAKYPTFWSFNSGAVSKISNQYAAMPSVHICWATWCAFAFVPAAEARVGQGARGRSIRSSRSS